MAKRPIIQTDSEDSDDAEKAIFPAPKRPKVALEAAQSSGSGSSSDPNSDAEWTMDRGGPKKLPASAKKGQKGGTGKGGAKGGGGGGGKGGGVAQRKIAAKKLATVQFSSDSSEEDEDDEEEDKEGGGQQSSESDGSSSDSDSDSSRGSLKFDDGLDDQLQGGEEDQKMLSRMTETERETEMYNRFERREALKTRFEIEQRLFRQKKTMKKQKQEKQKQLVRDKRRSLKTDNRKSQAMDEYKAKRSADKMRKAEAERLPDEKEPLKVSDVFSESDSEESSTSSSDESDFKEGFRSSKPISTVAELAKVKLSRYRLEKWVHMPFLDEAVCGCFVRVGIGAHEGRMVYRVCEVLGVQETQKVYNLGGTKTNKGLRLRHGVQERVFRMEYVSNCAFVNTEFSKWVAEMEKRGLKLPTADFVQRKVKELEKFKTMSLKEEDVEKIVKEKQRFRKTPRNYAMTKSRLIREKDLAEQEGDAEKAKSLAEKLQELEERADQLDKQRTKGLSAISYINERNRHRNVVRAELALKEEMAANEGKEDDPFTRRKCQPTLVTLAVRDGGVEFLQTSPNKSTPTKPEAAEGNGEVRTSSVQMLGKGLDDTPNPGMLSATPIPLASSPTELPVSDLFSAHDFDIQIDLPSPDDSSATPKSLSRPSAVPRQDGPKRSLNLADYKKRRGLI